MTTRKRNEYLDIGSSDEEGSDRGYDSEAAEEGKGRQFSRKETAHTSPADRSSKRRKLSISEVEESENGLDDEDYASRNALMGGDEGRGGDERFNMDDDDFSDSPQQEEYEEEDEKEDEGGRLSTTKSKSKSSKSSKEKDRSRKHKTGVIYLSSLPPYLKPSALKSMLIARGFGPITKIFLTPYVPPSGSSSSKRRNRRRAYTDGWVEFQSKRTAKICAETLNATIVGGKKGGWYHDDVLNMKYLRGFKWSDLMEQVQRERGEREARRRIEDSRARKEEKAFLAGVEKGKVVEGIKRKREEKGKREGKGGGDGNGGNDGDRVRRVFRQNEVRAGNGADRGDKGAIDKDAKRVLGKIF
ncbi:RNA-binding ATPase activator esf2 [Arachnomyces sp. PD_36]|nr:RNA-binding ATPase activator esf2 [Arachnomyces sp. PD_36]